MPRLRFAGQITGCEGYVESAAIGLIAGRMAVAARRGDEFVLPPATTAVGALLNHITGGHIASIDSGPQSFQPMNVNFGLFPPLTEPLVAAGEKRLRGPEKSAARKKALSLRAARDLEAWIGAGCALAAE
jgi:methylenetetrahydrofolate--tRNA-(uracil-5-)-methyltransferase